MSTDPQEPHPGTPGAPALGIPSLFPWVALAAGLAGCGAGSPPPDAGEVPVRVGIHTVQEEELELHRRWVGRLEPLLMVSLQAPRDGRVDDVAVRDGEAVEPGQILVRMAGPDLEARRSAAEERRSQLDAELLRWEQLASAGAAGPGEVAEATLRTLQAREQLAELEALRESYLLRAPVRGRVYGTSVGPGAQIVGGQAVLWVEDDSSWGVRLSVPAWETRLLEDTSSLVVRDDAGRILLVSRIAFSSEAHPGFVRADIYLQGDTDARAGVEIERRTSTRAMVIPWTAVADEGSEHWVAFVVPGDPDRVERRTVRLGAAHARGVEILEGLDPGDRVVRYEPRSHQEGRSVEPVESAR